MNDKKETVYLNENKTKQNKQKKYERHIPADNRKTRIVSLLIEVSAVVCAFQFDQFTRTRRRRK